MLTKAGFKNIIIEPLDGRFIVLYDVILPKKMFIIRIFFHLFLFYQTFYTKNFIAQNIIKRCIRTDIFLLLKNNIK